MTIYVKSEEMATAGDKNSDAQKSVKCQQSEKDLVAKLDQKSAAKVRDDQDVLDIPGIKHIYDSKYTLIGKLVWMAILITCTVIMLVHVINRVRYYMSMPVAVDILIENNATMFYPDVTLCSAEPYNRERYENVKRAIANVTHKDVASVTIDDILQHMTVMDLWNQIAFKTDDLFLYCGVEQNKACTYVGEWRAQYTVSGVCYTFTMKYPYNVSGSMYGMRITLNTRNLTAWKVLVHDHEDNPTAKIYTEGILAHARFTTDIRFKLKVFQLLSTNKRPCSDMKTSQCKVQCLSDLILQTSNCRLPFMENVDAPYCVPPNHTMANRTMQNFLIGSNSTCPCVQECVSYHYQTNIDATYSSDPPITRLRIYYETFDYVIIKENIAYGLAPLLSDIGGTLGLFMGISILTIVEIIAVLIIKSKQHYLRKQRAKQSSSMHNK